MYTDRSPLLGWALLGIFAVQCVAASPFNYAQEGRDWTNMGECVRPGAQMQSPIDINPLADREVDSSAEAKGMLPPLQICYRKFETESVFNDGLTIKVKVRPGSYVQHGLQKFELQELHLHTPSEHALYHQRYNMELQLVHTQRETGQKLVVALLMAQVNPNDPNAVHIPDFLASNDKFWSLLPRVAAAGAAMPLSLSVSTDNLLPSIPNRRYFFYMGSLTAPPCTENVLYFVIEDPVAVKNPLSSFTSIIPFNARVLQSLNGRKVYIGMPQFRCPALPKGMRGALLGKPQQQVYPPVDSQDALLAGFRTPPPAAAASPIFFQMEQTTSSSPSASLSSPSASVIPSSSASVMDPQSLDLNSPGLEDRLKGLSPDQALNMLEVALNLGARQ